ncbi:MAG: cytidine deaminase [Patescibacteria group bacterium]
MLKLTNNKLIKKANEAAKLYSSSNDVRIGDVGCALATDKNNIYQGASIDACCGVGFCAEHSAIASMITNGEYKIKKIVAVSSDGIILSPCGRCRELMYQVNEENMNANIIVEKNKIIKLRKLLPEPWQKKIDKNHS